MHATGQPPELLADLNGHLQTPGRSGRFIAMAFAVFEPARRVLRLANAGLPRPLLVRDGRVEVIDIVGVPLGLFPDTTYDAKPFVLEPGDCVVFCSDGIHEQTNACDEEFGLGRLISHLAAVCAGSSAQDITRDIARAVEEHAGPQSGSRGDQDDRTILTLRVTD
jgi:sigma-B regulation protein RsbU (phosphoserine phosphatase)